MWHRDSHHDKTEHLAQILLIMKLREEEKSVAGWIEKRYHVKMGASSGYQKVNKKSR